VICSRSPLSPVITTDHNLASLIAATVLIAMLLVVQHVASRPSSEASLHRETVFHLETQTRHTTTHKCCTLVACLFKPAEGRKQVSCCPSLCRVVSGLLQRPVLSDSRVSSKGLMMFLHALPPSLPAWFRPPFVQTDRMDRPLRLIRARIGKSPQSRRTCNGLRIMMADRIG
jgi:hypothetical protein